MRKPPGLPKSNRPSFQPQGRTQHIWARVWIYEQQILFGTKIAVSEFSLTVCDLFWLLWVNRRLDLRFIETGPLLVPYC